MNLIRATATATALGGVLALLAASYVPRAKPAGCRACDDAKRALRSSGSFLSGEADRLRREIADLSEEELLACDDASRLAVLAAGDASGPEAGALSDDERQLVRGWALRAIGRSLRDGRYMSRGGAAEAEDLLLLLVADAQASIRYNAAAAALDAGLSGDSRFAEPLTRLRDDEHTLVAGLVRQRMAADRAEVAR